MRIVFTPEFEKSLKRLIWHERLAPINPKTYWYNLKGFYRRGKRGYSNTDLWNFNSYLAEMIPKALRQLKAEKMGYPDNPFHPTGMTEKKWDAIMDKMIRGFEAYAEMQFDYDHLPNSAWRKKREKQWQEGSKLFIKWFGALWD